MGRIVKVLIGLVFFLIAAVAAAIYLVPLDTYRAQITALAREATGRNLLIEGDIHLSVWPEIGIEVGDVSFSNASGATDAQMATMKSLILGVELMPLFSGEIKVNRLVLREPVVSLERFKNGSNNWTFDESAGDQGAETGPAPTTGGELGLSDIKLEKVELIGGSITYRDGRAGTIERIDDINLALGLAGLDSPLSVNGSLTWNKERLEVNAVLGAPRALLSGGASPVRLELDSDVAKARFDGSANPDKGAAQGALTVETPSLRRFIRFAGSEMPPGEGLEAFSLSGNLTYTGGQVGFRHAKLSLDDMVGEGDILATMGATPTIKGNLNLDRLDLNRYLRPESAERAATGPTQGGWSDDAIDLSGLKGVNAEFTVTAGELFYRKLRIGQSTLRLSLKNGVLNAVFDELKLYDGHASGSLVADGSRAMPTVRAALDVEGVKAVSFLADAAGFDDLEGIGALRFDLSGAGRSQRVLMGSLKGNGAFGFADGAIVGVDLEAIARSVLNALSGDALGSGARTEFVELGGTFTVERGVVTNTDFKLLNALVMIAGDGEVGLGARTINYRFMPTLSALGGGDGQGGAIGALAVPFIVRGSWSNPSIDVDWERFGSLIQSGAISIEGIQNLLNGGLDPSRLGMLPQNVLSSLKGELPMLQGLPGLEGILPGATPDGGIWGDILGGGAGESGLPSIPGFAPGLPQEDFLPDLPTQDDFGSLSDIPDFVPDAAVTPAPAPGAGNIPSMTAPADNPGFVPAPVAPPVAPPTTPTLPVPEETVVPSAETAPVATPEPAPAPEAMPDAAPATVPTPIPTPVPTPAPDAVAPAVEATGIPAPVLEPTAPPTSESVPEIAPDPACRPRPVEGVELPPLPEGAGELPLCPEGEAVPADAPTP